MAGPARETFMEFNLTLPDWALRENEDLPARMPTLEERMAAVIRFSRLNFEQGTGGPFAAGVFECDSGMPVLIGVNRVMPLQCSSAHAEVTTLTLAQQKLGTWDLGAAGMPALQLVVNWRTCVMCYGAVIWSGIRSLVIAGSGPELETITGFDEGPIHPHWKEELERRGIEVVDNLLKDEAVAVFRDFAASGSYVYNARQGNQD